tara:strand:- start:486 stop:983 length:498 start_codon:yes stop_codon:yes gene_type:complete
MLEINDKKTECSEAPLLLNMTLWPNRSLDKKTFVLLMVVTFGAMMIPIVPFVGTKTILIVLPFSIITILLLFFSIILNYQHGKLYENIKIWPGLIEVKRYERDGTRKEWRANPYWTKINLYEESEKIQNYLTLSGSGREVEVGAFLAPTERLEIKKKIESIFKQM